MANARDVPEEKSVRAFMTALDSHSKVSIVSRRHTKYTLDVKLESGTSLAVFVTNLYVVGEADVREILSNHPDVNCVVTLSAWNMVSGAAMLLGRQLEVGVFTWKDFFGAINYRKYWLYEELRLGISAAEAAAERTRRRRIWN
jgi:hypothetical protein